ncbi:cytochrome-c oxidase, cbb3-type subunit I [Halomonas sp. McH1-25]|uniref:cytochrome-c oxidase, cbb3-type subunit I n=1 Tax=unclassified Halomonas TaxID=2609666 RepID=UPI001EF569A1|nr:MULTISPECIES: cytochrome-c oxidase, cbb3-type subunit I [unclassified Halomonas]MCG7600698.1 cytochrome-c oxidase, cbb3-type subunit I [Halomonas sp. McH1-25]MCP1341276.1 cytochrome-c oxidase, cbb3-type subunit I [Halomonas sp. FL8]MCP1361831.1 cytochrome-c oxidase, cbb3-type subunit I [Halomonas sp. BBD45]
MSTTFEHPTYNYKVVRQFAIMTVVWGIIGMALGVFIAAQLVWPELNFGLPWTSFGRLRPLHTNAVIFAFGGSALMATSLYVVQRTCQTRLFSDGLAAFTFWGWQAVIVLAVITLPMGYTTSKEYAELEWPIDILITLVWVAYAIVFLGTIKQRKTPHIYVANWFYAAFILTVAVLHIVNSAEVPVGPMKSYSAYAGAIDAMAQWWYGHNAVGFLLTAGFLGMMYYFVPKQAERPIYSYRLSIVHFWALITTYMWAGSHHLHYTALPDWAQSLGMIMSIILLAPSWGGMINGMMTLSGAWHKLRTDPTLRFLVVALSFYGMSTFEGPMMAVKTVNALSHYTDWTIGHVHAGALGWVAMITIGSMYHLIPRLFGGQAMYSEKLIAVHFWLATIGTVLYITAMWVNGIMQGLMWRAVNADGTLMYTFVEALEASHPGYIVRWLGGCFFTAGMLLMAFNVYKTVKRSEHEQAPVAQTA